MQISSLNSLSQSNIEPINNQSTNNLSKDGLDANSLAGVSMQNALCEANPVSESSNLEQTGESSSVTNNYNQQLKNLLSEFFQKLMDVVKMILKSIGSAATGQENPVNIGDQPTESAPVSNDTQNPIDTGGQTVETGNVENTTDQEPTTTTTPTSGNVSDEGPVIETNPEGDDLNNNGIVDSFEARTQYDAPLGKTKPANDVEEVTYSNPWRNPDGWENANIQDSFVIDGSAEFKQNVTAALEQIRKNDPDSFKMVYSYCGRFAEGNSSGMYAFNEPPTFSITLGETKDPDWLESIIVHDSFHSCQYWENMYEPTLGDNLERNANEIAAEYNDEKGNTSLSAYLRSLDGAHWR